MVGASKRVRWEFHLKGFADSGQNLGDDQGVTSQFKEVCRDTDLLQVEHFAPDLCHKLFNFGFWRHISGLFGHHGYLFEEGFTIDFSRWV